MQGGVSLQPHFRAQANENPGRALPASFEAVNSTIEITLLKHESPSVEERVVFWRGSASNIDPNPLQNAGGAR